MYPLLVFGAALAALLLISKEKKEAKMPAVQKYFEEFHRKIKLDEDDEKENLRDKRDKLLEALKQKLGNDVPTFSHFHQGSYAMHTGVVPLDGNYDIDVGLVFDCKKDEYPDPVELKKKVRDALNTNGRTVNIRRPCVTVNYMRDNKPEYHVDLAIYVKRTDALLDLAKGKENSDESLRIWEPADPGHLTELICNRFDDEEERAQYRRCIRYLKRWRDVQFRNGGAPLSIALTVAAKDWFSPRMDASGKPTDLLALLDWVKDMSYRFEYTSVDGVWHDRLKVQSPVTPFGDLMAKLTVGQMEVFQSKLDALTLALEKAYDEELPEDACTLLNAQFGADFEIPAKADTAKNTPVPFISTGSSA